MIGNALEWADFALYGYFSTLLAKRPVSDPVTSPWPPMVFAAGFFMCPLGGIFGYIGDRIGRKKALLWSIYLMSFPHCHCLPAHLRPTRLGAPLLPPSFAFPRSFHGGEFTGSIIFIVEHAEGRQRYFGAVSPPRAPFGILIGSGLAAF